MTEARTLKLILPLDPVQGVRGAVAYALRRNADGLPVQATLAHVTPPMGSGELLWFRRRDEVARFRAETSRALLADAASPLERAGIAVRLEHAEGEVAFVVADLAERHECDEIVLPRQYPRWIGLLAGDPFVDLWHGACRTPMVTVDEGGSPLQRKPAIVRASVSPGIAHAASRRPDHPPAPG